MFPLVSHNFLEEISSLSHSVVFLYFFASIPKEVYLPLQRSLFLIAIHNLRYADDTTFMAEIEEELTSLLFKMKQESENAGVKLNIQKMKIMASGPIHCK